jgi:hypothetical protein
MRYYKYDDNGLIIMRRNNTPSTSLWFAFHQGWNMKAHSGSKDYMTIFFIN